MCGAAVCSSFFFFPPSCASFRIDRRKNVMENESEETDGFACQNVGCPRMISASSPPQSATFSSSSKQFCSEESNLNPINATPNASSAGVASCGRSKLSLSYFQISSYYAWFWREILCLHFCCVCACVCVEGFCCFHQLSCLSVCLKESERRSVYFPHGFSQLLLYVQALYSHFTRNLPRSFCDLSIVWKVFLPELWLQLSRILKGTCNSISNDSLIRLFLFEECLQ